MLKKPYTLMLRNTGYYYYLLRGEKTRHSTRCKDYDKAVEFVEKLIHGDQKKQQYVLFSEFTKDFFILGKCKWIAYQRSRGRKFNDQSAKDRRSYLTRLFMPRFGNRLISSITNFEIDEFLQELDYAHATKNTLLYTLRTIFEEAIRHGFIDKNPADRVKRFAVRGFAKERDYLRLHEIHNLFPSDDNKLLDIWGSYFNASLCYLMLTTGMRNGEARALKWSDFIFDNDLQLRELQRQGKFDGGFVRINRSSRADNSIGSTKNGKSRAALIVPRAKELLLKHQEYSPYTLPEEFVFTFNGNTPVWASVPLDALRKALGRAQIRTEGRNLVVHSLRHTFVTLSRGKNVDEQILKDTVGHTDPHVTDIYDHNDKQSQLMTALFDNREMLSSVFLHDGGTGSSFKYG